MDAEEIKRRLNAARQILDTIEGMLDADVAEFPAELSELVDQRICLECRKKIPQSQNPVRGNHPSCYRRIARRIDSGDLSESEAIRNGLLAPKRAPGPKPGPRSTKNSALDEYLANRDRSDEAAEEQAEHFAKIAQEKTEQKRKKASKRQRKPASEEKR